MRAETTNQLDTKKKAPMAKMTDFSPKIKSKIMSKWSKISESNVDAMNGSFEMLATQIQEIYSYPKTKADKECLEFKKVNKLD
jgi:hypothetical protein